MEHYHRSCGSYHDRLWFDYDLFEFRSNENAVVSFKIDFPDRIGNLPLLVLEKSEKISRAQRKYFRNSQFKIKASERNRYIYFIFGRFYRYFKISGY